MEFIHCAEICLSNMRVYWELHVVVLCSYMENVSRLYKRHLCHILYTTYIYIILYMVSLNARAHHLLYIYCFRMRKHFTFPISSHRSRRNFYVFHLLYDKYTIHTQYNTHMRNKHPNICLMYVRICVFRWNNPIKILLSSSTAMCMCVYLRSYIIPPYVNVMRNSLRWAVAVVVSALCFMLVLPRHVVHQETNVRPMKIYSGWMIRRRRVASRLACMYHTRVMRHVGIFLIFYSSRYLYYKILKREISWKI